MELIDWNDNFNTGIAGIDTEHQELIETINTFYSMITHDPSKDTLVEMLNNIYATIHAHFMLEERLMKKYGYDEYESHRDDHARLLDDIRDITEDVESPLTFDEEKLKTKLDNWFLSHFKTHDARLHKLEQLMAHPEKTDNSFITRLTTIKNRLFK